MRTETLPAAPAPLPRPRARLRLRLPGRPRPEATATVSFAAAFELGAVLLPALLIGTLGGTPALLALVEGLGLALATAARLGAGAVIHRPRARRALGLGGYAATTALTGLLALAAAAWQVATLRVGAWIAMGLRAPGIAVAVAEDAPAGRLGRAFGAERAADYVGAALGSALAVALVALLDPRAALACALIPGGIALWAALRESRPASAPGPVVPRRPWTALRRLARGNLGSAFAGIAAAEAANISFTLLILRATTLLEEEHGVTTAVLVALTLFVGYRLAACAGGLLGGRAIDRFGVRPVLAVGSLLLLAAYGMFAETTAQTAALAVAFVAAGLGLGLLETAEHAAVARWAPAEDRAFAFGVLGALQSGGRAVASIAAGLLWTLVSPAAGLLVTAPLLVLCPLILFAGAEAEEHRLGRRRKPPAS
jgi:MFS family permease